MADMLTDLFVKGLKPGEKEYTRREKGGFGVRVHPGGRKTFFYLYRVDGHRRFLNLGDYPATSLKAARMEYEEARAKIKAIKAGRNDIVDPLEVRKTKAAEREERRAAHTVKELVKEYLEKHAVNKRSGKADERLLNVEIVPEWGHRKAEDIKKRDIILLLESIIERGAPAMSNQVLKITRKMFNFAVERDILPHSPFAGVKALAPNKSRERALTEAEIKTLWATIDNAAISDDIRRAIKLVLVTGQRPGEIAGMHSAEIEGQWWTIPAGRAKNGMEHRVYLTASALELIGPLTAIDEETGEEVAKGNIFPCPHKKKNKPIEAHALAVAVRRNLNWPLLDKGGKPLYDKEGNHATENRLGVDQFTPHDLRRTAATFMASMGFMDEVIDAVLSHKKQGIIKTYNRHKYDREKQQALESWERKLKAITASKESNVIPMKRKVRN
ncbi:Integrase [Citrifermentans bremense]|uniref:Integrase n=1 Tax=Citrifermentans bremense TaxID=60035 RepID=A0A6S6LZV6_9BACT|nr:site-specific integrase [Citrifermentans bremense]BCG46839.1 Integrase [Citrifermentans bremense]